ncbi:acyl-CoA carboxylase subunit epsilon [Corynebacterium uterequi]|uniref:Acyl-CoA carboxylase epsilon subunit n=1 Tax=Corynebacterium uterequi TaxID=1072256 RepID=A0A0G3HAX6_9CORY|nr:acyl-CoA carboxylase subunit epsilon [Corynebacterium uterequi]AKK10504.1 Acyl-CoA carboxylase epsilon subunit [Corynebacterium uterequi]
MAELTLEILGGRPTAAEVAALTDVLTRLRDQACARADYDRNRWGRPTSPYQRGTVFNPNAYRAW